MTTPEPPGPDRSPIEGLFEGMTDFDIDSKVEDVTEYMRRALWDARVASEGTPPIVGYMPSADDIGFLVNGAPDLYDPTQWEG